MEAIEERRASWRPMQRAKNDAIFVAASALIGVARLVPQRWLRRGGVVAASLARVLWPSARRLAEANVARVFPELDAPERRALVRDVYQTLGETLGDAIASLDHPLPPLDFPEPEKAVFERAIAEGRGVLFASGHLGPWERVASTIAASGIPLVAVTREPYDPRFAALYARLRRNVRTVPRGAPGAAMTMLRTLRRGHVLGIPMDLASRVPSVTVPFLGHPAPTPVGPARLALRTGAAVLVGSVQRPGGTPPGLALSAVRIPTSDLSPGADGERVLTARINDELSRRIRALPTMWPWMHERFPTL